MTTYADYRAQADAEAAAYTAVSDPAVIAVLDQIAPWFTLPSGTRVRIPLVDESMSAGEVMALAETIVSAVHAVAQSTDG